MSRNKGVVCMKDVILKPTTSDWLLMTVVEVLFLLLWRRLVINALQFFGYEVDKLCDQDKLLSVVALFEW